jgi:peptide deformylase
MAVREIRIYGDPGLRKKAYPVKEVNSQTKRLIKDMVETMHENRGVGLAANQIGVDKQVMIVDAGEGLLALINPRVVDSSGEESDEEGCLSLPDIRVGVRRAKKIGIRGLNEEGEEIDIETEGFLSRAIQHEMDHLNGILIIDRISLARRQLIKSQLKRLQERSKDK